MENISQLSDAELREALASHGVNVGPIVPSTRSVYEKKLAKFFNNEIDHNNESRNNENLISKVIEQPIDQEPIKEQKKAKSPAPIVELPTVELTEQTKGDKDASDIEDYEGEESMRYLTEEELAADRKAYQKERNGKNRKNIFGNLVIISIAFAAIGVFAYFLLENAETFLNSSASSSSDPNDTI